MSDLITESTELCKILAQSIVTAKQNTNRPNGPRTA